jgi:ParB/RepB/Spo0J family partition protein
MDVDSSAARFDQIRLEQIDLKDKTFAFAFPGEADEILVKTIGQYGIVVPVILQERPGKRYRIVAGHRRLAAAETAGLQAVPARIAGGGMSDEALFLWNVRDNALTRTVNDVERARCLHRLVSEFKSSEGKIAEAMTLLGLASGRRIVEQYLSLVQLSSPLARYVTDHAIAVRVSARIAGYGSDGQAAVAELLRQIQLGGNALKEVLDLADEIGLREQTSVVEVLAAKEIRSILDNPKWTATQKKEKLKRALLTMRYPMLSKQMEEIGALLKEGGSLPRGSITPPPYLEGTDLQAAFSFKTIEELRAASARLGEMAEGAGIREVFKRLRLEGEK